MKHVIKAIVEHLEKSFNDNTFINEEHTEILQTLFFYFGLFNVWPKPGQKLRVYNLKLIIFFFSLLFTIGSCLAEIVHIFTVNRNYLLDDLLSGAALVGTGTSVCYGLTSFLKHNDDIQRLVFALGDFTMYPKPRNFDKVNKRMDTMIHLAVLYAIFGASLYVFLPILNRSACLIEAKELNLGKICGMIAPGLYPASFNSNPNFYIGYINQVHTCLTACVMALLIAFLLLGFCELLITRIQDFKHALSKPFHIQDEAARKEYLIYCVRYHCYILDLAEQLNKSMIDVVFILASFSAVMVACIGYQFMMKPELKSMLHVLGWLTMLTMMSVSGQKLINESSEITDVMWATNWFEGNIEAQKYVQMIIMRSQKHVHIRSYFGQISLETFASAMSCSYSILTLFANAGQ